MIPQLSRLSQETGIPLVATNDSHYMRKNDARAHEILLCIQTGKTMSDPNRMRFTQPEFYLKSRDEMMRHCSASWKQALDIAPGRSRSAASVKLEKVKEPFPKFDVPAEHTTDSLFRIRRAPGIRKAACRGWKRCAQGGRPEARSRRNTPSGWIAKSR